MFCHRTVCCCCLPLSTGVRFAGAVHIPIAIVLFYFGDTISVLNGLLSLLLALLVFADERRTLPWFTLLLSWLLLGVVNIFTFGFTLFFALNEMERVVRDDVSGGYNFAMAAVLALAVVIVVVLCYCWLVVLAYYQEMCLRITLPMSPLKAVVTDLPPTMTTIVGLQD